MVDHSVPMCSNFQVFQGGNWNISPFLTLSVDKRRVSCVLWQTVYSTTVYFEAVLSFATNDFRIEFRLAFSSSSIWFSSYHFIHSHATNNRAKFYYIITLLIPLCYNVQNWCDIKRDSLKLFVIWLDFVEKINCVTNVCIFVSLPRAMPSVSEWNELSRWKVWRIVTICTFISCIRHANCVFCLIKNIRRWSRYENVNMMNNTVSLLPYISVLVQSDILVIFSKRFAFATNRLRTGGNITNFRWHNIILRRVDNLFLPWIFLYEPHWVKIWIFPAFYHILPSTASLARWFDAQRRKNDPNRKKEKKNEK